MGVEIEDFDKRNVWQAIGRGLMCRCPKCGEGKLFRGYLKVNDTCPVCGEELFHHRADDLPPYISIVIVGHVLIFAMLELEMRFQNVDPMWYLATLVPLAIVLPLATLPSIKGAVVGLQWANKMHGFDNGVTDPALPEEDPAVVLARKQG
jgi:uncharacterized protein (DUF983 family)